MFGACVNTCHRKQTPVHFDHEIQKLVDSEKHVQEPKKEARARGRSVIHKRSHSICGKGKISPLP